MQDHELQKTERKHRPEGRTKGSLGEMSGTVSVSQDGEGNKRASLSLLDFLEVAGMIRYCWPERACPLLIKAAI